MSPFLEAFLELESATRSGRFPLAPHAACRIGRIEGNTIVLADDMVSRNHALIQASDQGIYYLTDLGSTNGTTVNGTRITTPVLLRPSDRIQIGNHLFIFHQSALPTPAAPVADYQSTNILVQMKVITVLVVDIRDFTGLGQRIGDRLGDVAGTLFREAGQLLQSHGAWGQKYIGDAVMAIWMHADSGETAEFLPIFTALAGLRDIAGSLAARFQLSEPVRIGAGMNTGMASTGNFGSIAASDHTALGDTVNKAFRLESATKELGCDLVIGHDTFLHLQANRDAARLFVSRSVQLKGYPNPVIAFGAYLSALEDLCKALRTPLTDRTRTMRSF